MDCDCFGNFTLKNGAALVVRKPGADDAGRMIGLMTAVDAQTRFLAREPGEFDYTEEQERELILKRSGDPFSHWVVGTIDGRFVAGCDTRRVRARKRFAHRASLGILVLKDYWRLGIGRILIRDSIRWCREMGFEQLELDVVANNHAALSLYLSEGFEITGRNINALKYRDGSYADEYVMRLPLT